MVSKFPNINAEMIHSMSLFASVAYVMVGALLFVVMVKLGIDLKRKNTK